MSKFVKIVIVVVMVMGVFIFMVIIVVGNNGIVCFYGIIEDLVCFIVLDDYKLEVDMGDIGVEKLKNNGIIMLKNFQICL